MAALSGSPRRGPLPATGHTAAAAPAATGPSQTAAAPGRSPLRGRGTATPGPRSSPRPGTLRAGRPPPILCARGRGHCPRLPRRLLLRAACSPLPLRAPRPRAFPPQVHLPRLPPGRPGAASRAEPALGLQSFSSGRRSRNKRGGGASPAKLVGGGGAARNAPLGLLSLSEPCAHARAAGANFPFQGAHGRRACTPRARVGRCPVGSSTVCLGVSGNTLKTNKRKEDLRVPFVLNSLYRSCSAMRPSLFEMSCGKIILLYILDNIVAIETHFSLNATDYILPYYIFIFAK